MLQSHDSLLSNNANVNVSVTVKKKLRGPKAKGSSSSSSSSSSNSNNVHNSSESGDGDAVVASVPLKKVSVLTKLHNRQRYYKNVHMDVAVSKLVANANASSNGSSSSLVQDLEMVPIIAPDLNLGRGRYVCASDRNVVLTYSVCSLCSLRVSSLLHTQQVQVAMQTAVPNKRTNTNKEQNQAKKAKTTSSSSAATAGSTAAPTGASTASSSAVATTTPSNEGSVPAQEQAKVPQQTAAPSIKPQSAPGRAAPPPVPVVLQQRPKPTALTPSQQLQLLQQQKQLLSSVVGPAVGAGKTYSSSTSSSPASPPATSAPITNATIQSIVSRLVGSPMKFPLPPAPSQYVNTMMTHSPTTGAAGSPATRPSPIQYSNMKFSVPLYQKPVGPLTVPSSGGNSPKMPPRPPSQSQSQSQSQSPQPQRSPISKAATPGSSTPK
jgi:hypothetical protein